MFDTNYVRQSGASRMTPQWHRSVERWLSYSINNRPTYQNVCFRSQAMLGGMHVGSFTSSFRLFDIVSLSLCVVSL